MRLARRLTLFGILWVMPFMTNAFAQGEPTTRVFRLEHIDPSSLATTLSLFPARVQANNDLGTLTINTTPEVMTAIENLIADLDVLQAKRTIELVVHILNANNEAGTSDLPDTLVPVVEQLRSVFTYQSYEVLDTATIRALDGSNANTSGNLALPPFGQSPARPTLYDFRADFSLVMPDPDTTVLQLTRMRTGFRVPVMTDDVNWQYVNVGINTDVDIPEGQQVIVGKATIGESAIILVMSAEILD